MVLNPDQTLPVLYDLALTMAGETRPQPLASAMLQRLLFHTGCSCGLLLLNAEPAADGKRVAALAYAAIGNPALRALEGQTRDWPADVLAGEVSRLALGWLPPDAAARHVLSLALPALGHILLFSDKPHDKARQKKSLLAPVLSKFAGSLRHCLESEAKTQTLASSEARIRGILESTPDWIWETGPDGVLSFSNGKIFDSLGYPPEQALGKKLFELMPEQEARHVGWTFLDIVAKREAFRNLEANFRHRDGHEVAMEMNGVPILDDTGNLAGYRGVARDVTERVHDLEALTKARNDALVSDRSKALFLSSMSHEIRTPLNAILGHAQLIGMQEDLPANTATSAQEIQHAGKVLLSLINNILEFTVISSGETDIRPESFALGEIIESCLADNAEAASWNKVPIRCARACGQCQVRADRAALLMVLNQLVSNAIKFNREGGKVAITCNAKPSGQARIAVTDEGPGIPAAEQVRLFTPFSRLGHENRGPEGAGIGLVIAKQLIESMSGSIGVESAAGAGSTFWVEIPLAAPMAPELPQSGPRVLVAEDYLPNQAVIQTQLSSLGCEVDIAANGAEALKLWKQNAYDLILVDLDMPVMDGLAFARALRRQEAGSGRRIPVVCITAAAVAAELEQCREAGMDETLTKPLALETLRGLVERWGSAQDKARLAASAGSPGEDALLDLDALYRILGEANPEQARGLIATFIESADKGLAQLAAGTDPARVAREMHKQKSSARTVGAARYARLAESLEQQAKEGLVAGLAPALVDLRDELDRVRAAAGGLQQDAQPGPAAAPTLSGYGSVLVVDDDPVVLQQMSAMLASLGIKEVLASSSGREALRLLGERNARLDALICDLDMPEMDGVELIRLFGRTGFNGGLILMSGADEKVLNTVAKLAHLHGLRVLGQLVKPVAAAQIASLLTKQVAPRARKRPSSAPVEVSPQAIREGMDRDEFTVWLQPKVDAVSLKPVGFEALGRWQHPGRGMVPPEVFIGVAEREGLIRELSHILVTKSLMDGAKVHEAGIPLTLSINLSGLWLDDLMLPDFILATTQAARLRPADIILEVTETGVMKDLATALDVLTRLRLKGFGLSIDDFGIGYSSFEQLDRIPFTELKLDRIFVSKGVHDSTARAILQSSMDMARRMALSTVAEGVETEEDLDLVRELGCDLIQGHLIAKPMPVEDLIAWLKKPGH